MDKFQLTKEQAAQIAEKAAQLSQQQMTDFQLWCYVAVFVIACAMVDVIASKNPKLIAFTLPLASLLVATTIYAARMG